LTGIGLREDRGEARGSSLVGLTTAAPRHHRR
jgi:hypothetical protein